VGYEEGRALLSPGQPVNLAAEIGSLNAMARDIRQLEASMRGLSGTTTKLDGRAGAGDILSVQFRLPARDVLNVATFLEDMGKMLAMHTLVGAAGMVGMYKTEALSVFDVQKWCDNVHPLIAPWRDNKNDWIIDFFGHTLFGVGLAAYFRQLGYSRLVSFVATVLSDIFWEYAIEGWVAPPEANDLITTAIIGNIIGVLGQSATVGPITISLAPIVDPVAKKLAIGATFSQNLTKNLALNVGIGKSQAGILTTAELEIGKRVSVGAFAEGDLGSKQPSKVGVGVKVNF
jgi:hypothetical protein